jgi:hypothetical protein
LRSFSSFPNSAIEKLIRGGWERGEISDHPPVWPEFNTWGNDGDQNSVTTVIHKSKNALWVWFASVVSLKYIDLFSQVF